MQSAQVHRGRPSCMRGGGMQLECAAVSLFSYVCVCVCVCVRARVRACVRACLGGGVLHSRFRAIGSDCWLSAQLWGLSLCQQFG
jgi:hypothetical protein